MNDDHDHDWERDDQPTQRELSPGQSQSLDESSSSRIGTKLGQFTINRVIGSGGMGTVYKATQETPRRTVALKVMKSGLTSPQAMKRFHYEAEVLARLRHPCIAQVYESQIARVNLNPAPCPVNPAQTATCTHAGDDSMILNRTPSGHPIAPAMPVPTSIFA